MNPNCISDTIQPLSFEKESLFYFIRYFFMLLQFTSIIFFGIILTIRARLYLLYSHIEPYTYSHYCLWNTSSYQLSQCFNCDICSYVFCLKIYFRGSIGFDLVRFKFIVTRMRWASFMAFEIYLLRSIVCLFNGCWLFRIIFHASLFP